MSRSHPRRALGASVLAATAFTVLHAGAASASTVPKPVEVTRALPFSCAIPGSLVEDPPVTDAQVTSTEGFDYPAGWSFPSGAKGYATVRELGGAFDRAGARDVSYSGTWRWHVGGSTAPWSGNDTPFSAPLTVPQGGGPADPRVPLAVAAPTSVLAIGGNQAYVDALRYVFRATTAAGTPADFGFVDDGDGDPTTLAVSCTGPRTLVSTVFAVTPPPTPPVTPPTPSPSPTPSPTPRPTPVSLAGPAKLALNGSLSGTIASWGNVSGSLDPDGAFTGSASVGPATGTTTALGLLPIRATFAFTPAGPATGNSSRAGGFTLATTQDVAVKGASFLGLPIATGTCHTATPAAITLTSTTPGATLTAGGTASGSFVLGRLTGCSTLGSLFGTNGGRATLQVQLSPFPVQPPVPPTPTPKPPMPPTV